MTTREYETRTTKMNNITIKTPRKDCKPCSYKNVGSRLNQKARRKGRGYKFN